MKLIKCNGRVLEVYDLGPCVFRLTAGAVPLKYNGWRIAEDDEARAVLRELLACGLYAGGRTQEAAP